MAIAALTPRVRIMAICDGVRESNTEAGVFHLKGVRQRMVVHSVPFVPSRLWLFLLLSSPRPGEFPGYVVIIQDQTDKTIFFGQLKPRPIFQGDDMFWATRYRIRCSFPAEGRYTVQLWFFQEQGSDVLKGETPFTIEKQGA